MKKLAETMVHVSAVMPAEMHARLIRQVGKETTDRGRAVTRSAIIRWAIEDYLDQWETASFVPAHEQAKEI